MSNSDTNAHKKQAAMDAVLEATAMLANAQTPSIPTARDVAKKSGYAVGTIYRYFSSIGGVITQIVIKRQTTAMQAIAKAIENHNPDHKADALVEHVVQMCFASFQAFRPELVRFAFNVATSNAERPEALNRVVDNLVPIFATAQSRDRTGTFKPLTAKQSVYILRTAVYMIRTPLLEDNDFFATLEHKRLVIRYLIAMFSSVPEQETLLDVSGHQPIEAHQPAQALA